MVWTEEIVEKSTPEELVKMQLDEWAATDPALAEAYHPENIGDCWTWIVDKAKRSGKGGDVAIWHGTVFRWARDYFVDGHATGSPSTPAEVSTRKERPVAIPKRAPETETDGQLDLFAEGV